MSERRRRIALAIVTLGSLVLLATSLQSLFGLSDAGAASASRIFVCSETNQPFRYTLREGDTLPVPSPYTGRRTGHPAELCNWTPDGQPSDRFTPVLLNSLRNLPGPTFCPDCKRLVVPLNPPADAARPAPPTEAQHAARRSSNPTKPEGR